MADPLMFALIVGAGLLAGIASGLFGVGGGVLMVPAALFLVPGTGFHQAKAVSLLVIVASAGIGVWTHHAKGSVSWRRGALLAAAGIVGSALAVVLVEPVSDGALRVGFGIVLAATGLRLALGREPREHNLTPSADTVLMLTAGFLAGLLAGAFGVGGGILMVPIMVFAGIRVHLAVGTSLVAVLVNAASATATHIQLGYGPTLLAVGIPLALGAVPGTRVGSVLAHKLHAERLRKAFGWFLVVIGLAIAAQGVWG